MLYGSLRVILFSAIFIICLILTAKVNPRLKQKYRLISLILSMVFCTISGMLPVENLIFSFSSPEQAYKYYNVGKIVLTVNGENSDLVIGEKKDTYVYAMIPKTSDGWKISFANNVKRIGIVGNSSTTVEIEQFKNSSDYYVSVSDISSEQKDVSDNMGASFACLKKENTNTTYYTYIAHISKFNEDYTVFIGDTEMKISSGKLW